MARQARELGRAVVRVRFALAWAVAVLLVGGVIGWAVAVATRPPQQVAAESTYVLVEAKEGAIGQSVAAVVTASWPLRQVAVNQASGTITRLLVSRGEDVEAGDVLYRVDERAVVALPGAVPAFRALTLGVSGADVTQLTRFLVAKKFLASTTSTFTASVQRAVRSWQKSLGVAGTGRLDRGDVLFVKTLPVRVALSSKFAVGGQVSAGDPAIEALASAPRFSVQYSDLQAKQVTEGMAITVDLGTQRWKGSVGPLTVTQDGSVKAPVRAAEGRTLCGEQCGKVPLQGTTQLKGTTEVQQSVAGVVVPLAALVSDANGSPGVIAADGQRVTVKVVARARGMAVVEGLAAGTAVRVPGQ